MRVDGVQNVLAALVLAAGLLLAPAAQAENQNILLLSVDTLRADRLGCYGYEFDTSPRIDALAEQSLLFEDCVCEVPLTFPSMGSMLCSQFPRATGTTRNGLRMPDDAPLVQELFRAAGYTTWCVQSNWTLKAKLSGLDRGFDLYEDDFHEGRWGFIKAERTADEVTETALRVLAGRDRSKPFFAWIHYTDPHAPYELHRKFNPQDRSVWWRKNEEKVQIKYDSEVAFTDHHIARLLEALPDNTSIVFTADHGESLWEHDYLGHGRYVYQMGLHIPLMIHAPGVAPGRTARPVRGIDVGPTLLALAGITPAEPMLGLNVLENTPQPRARVVETYGGAVPKVPGVRALLANAGPLWRGVLLDGWKLIFDGDKDELYHLPEDPDELNDLSGTRLHKVRELRAVAQEWDTGTTQAEETGKVLDEDDIRALESLGYIE